MPATAGGMGVGLVVGATSVDYGTRLADLALMGALTGVFAVDRQVMVFGASGALVFTVLSGLVLHRLLPPAGRGLAVRSATITG